MSRRVEQPEITPAGESPRSLACMPGHEAAPPPSRAPFFPLWTFQGASLSGPLPDPVTGLGMSVAASTRPSANRCLLLIDDEPAQRRLVTPIGARAGDRKSVVQGKRLSGSVNPGGQGINKKKNRKK